MSQAERHARQRRGRRPGGRPPGARRADGARRPGDAPGGRDIPGRAARAPSLRRPGPLRPLRGAGPARARCAAGRPSASPRRRSTRATRWPVRLWSPAMPPSGCRPSRSGSSAWPAETWPRRPRSRRCSATTTPSPGSRAITWTSTHPLWTTTPPTSNVCSESWPGNTGLRGVSPSLTALAKLPQVLREGEWTVTAEVEQRGAAERPGGRTRPTTGCSTCCPGAPPRTRSDWPSTSAPRRWSPTWPISPPATRSTASRPTTGRSPAAKTWCRASSTPAQPKRRQELQERVVSTINELIDAMLGLQHLTPEDIGVGGGGGQHHHDPPLPGPRARLHPPGTLRRGGRALPAGARRRGSGCTCTRRPSSIAFRPWEPMWAATSPPGVIRSGMHEEEAISLFIDVGTNGEMVLGNSEWLISCACSAGPAFEGAGATSGMRAVQGSHRGGVDRPAHARAHRDHGGRRRPPRHLRFGDDLAPGRDDGHRGHRQERPDRGRRPHRPGAPGPQRRGVRGGLGRRDGHRRARHRAQRDRHPEPHARQGGHLRGRRGAVRERGPGDHRRRAGAHRRLVRPPHRRGEGHPDRAAARPPLGPLLLPGQHLAPGRLPGPDLPGAPGADRRGGRQDDLPGAERRQSLHGRFHLGAVPPPHRREPVPVGAGEPGRRSDRKGALAS